MEVDLPKAGLMISSCVIPTEFLCWVHTKVLKVHVQDMNDCPRLLVFQLMVPGANGGVGEKNEENGSRANVQGSLRSVEAEGHGSEAS
jgi:hypothetical protein